MTATTPMATPDTMPWLSSMVVTIFVKQPSNAYLRIIWHSGKTNKLWHQSIAFFFSLTCSLMGSAVVESEIFCRPVKYNFLPKTIIFFATEYFRPIMLLLITVTFSEWKPGCHWHRSPPKHHSPTSTHNTPPEPGCNRWFHRFKTRNKPWRHLLLCFQTHILDNQTNLAHPPHRSISTAIQQRGSERNFWENAMFKLRNLRPTSFWTWFHTSL